LKRGLKLIHVSRRFEVKASVNERVSITFRSHSNGAAAERGDKSAFSYGVSVFCREGDAVLEEQNIC